MSRNCEQHPELFPPAPTSDYDPDRDGWKADALADLRRQEALAEIIVIGLSPPANDLFTLARISEWLERHRPDLQAHQRILRREFAAYDMATMPEKGDALDAIDPDTRLVIALHLFGIDQIPGGSCEKVTALDPKRCYNRDNIHLLELCMKHGAPLIAVGDQPWLGLEKRTQMYGTRWGEPEVYIYENKEER